MDRAEIFTMHILYNKKLGAVPLYHYDQLMRRGWKVFLPISLLFVVLVSSYYTCARCGL